MSDPGWQPPQEPGYGQQPPPYGQPPNQGGYQQHPYGYQQPPSYPQQQPPYGYGGRPGGSVSPADERTWGMMSHLGPLLGSIVLTYFAVVVPLVVYLVYKDRSPFIRHHAAQALNFWVTGLIYGFVLVIAAFLTFGLALIPLLVLAIAEIVLAIMASVAANRGEWYRYPTFLAFPMFS